MSKTQIFRAVDRLRSACVEWEDSKKDLLNLLRYMSKSELKRIISELNETCESVDLLSKTDQVRTPTSLIHLLTVDVVETKKGKEK